MDKAYATFFGVTERVAKKNRESGNLEGRLAKLSQDELHRFAIDDLLGKHHGIKNGKPKLDFPYLDGFYLVTKVIGPAILNNQEAFTHMQCSVAQRAATRKYIGTKTVERALNQEQCRADVKTLPVDIFRNTQLRFVTLKLLAQKTSDPEGVLKKATQELALQIGGAKQRICWLYENPYPETIKPTAGENAHCQGYHKHMHNTRPGYHNYKYAARSVRDLAKSQIDEARWYLQLAGAKGSGFDKKLAKARRTARDHKCVAFTVTMAVPKGGKLGLHSVGESEDVSCKKAKKDKKLARAMPGNWNNALDKVLGGKLRGRWTKKYDHRRRCLRKTRPATIYVQRKL